MIPKNNDNFSTPSFYVEDHDMLVYRLWAIAVIIFLPFYGIVLQYSDPTTIDYMSHRLFISSIYCILLLLSFTSNIVKKYYPAISLAGNYIWVSWVIWIVSINHFTIDYTIGLFMSLSLTGISFRSQKEMLSFYISMLLLIFIAINNCENILITPSVLELSLFIMFIVYIISFIHRTHLNNRLSSLNQELIHLNEELVTFNANLEKKVADRTNIIQEKTLKLTAKNEELNRFTSIVSHDLKAPLRTISAFANILNKETEDIENPKIEECTQFLNSGVNRMVSIIDDLLDYSRLGQQSIAFKATSPEKMLFLVLNSITKDRSDVEVIINESLPTQIICNSRQIEQLFQNLIDNGIKYNRNQIKKISIDCKETPKEWIFSVQDNGIGISSSHREKVFDMFQRLHGTDEFKGTGIGLAICKRIVENHQGSISIQSEEEKGTTFQFSISKSLIPPKSPSKINPTIKDAIFTS